ncbi:hypothetical protein BCB4_0035 [Bacillus phage B4]|uniref:Uncharacterized protein n=2 Tax=Bequatrovirus B4 TaxID=1918005 RepID=J9PRD6_9CAUD|nr:hypothetical protein BCB4_0035 [Bacillus phage B4]YP_009783631.1 hypothetical protein QLX26_gp035 [Bacillus phage B5S]MEB9013890.1 hypothetical protein [Bacillus cereus]AEW47269.1 hypothetical protein B5S_0035 [Bacillus phage B5S]AEZ65828.1 hypothetical protein BCB4_0035 [Bacillus phage B4]MEB9190495.1 hypothetical protein [Bacillus cereus]
MDELKEVTKKVVYERIDDLLKDVAIRVGEFASLKGHDMYQIGKKETVLKRISIHKRIIEKLNELLYDLNQTGSDLEVNQLLDFIIRDRTRMRDHIEKAAVVSSLLYEDYMDYTFHNRIISEVNYIKITVRKTIEGEW